MKTTSFNKIYISIAAGLCILAVMVVGIFLSFSKENSEGDEDKVKSSGQDEEMCMVIKMASGTMQLADGGEATVELWMTSGRCYDEYSDDYLPSIYTYSQNYEGTYELRTVNEKGDILFQENLSELWTDANDTFNFPGEFELEWTDYNADGCPDFTIGIPFSSSNMGFLLITVREDGSLERLCGEEILLNNFEKFSVVFEHDASADGMPITGYLYNNTVGEVESVTYYYNEQAGVYEAEDDIKTDE